MTVLPADAHVHSEFSWDTGGPASDAAGRMAATCERAVRIGLPAIVLTDHLDLEDRWRVGPEDMAPHQRGLVDADGYVRLPPFDVDGYLESVDRCRYRFPDLRILTGLEFGQPHLRWALAARIVDLSLFDRVNGSLHTLELDDDRTEPTTLVRLRPAADVVRAYLAEVPALVAGPEPFPVVTHLDYAIRAWPEATAGPFDAAEFEEELRGAMRAIAASGRGLELNTRLLEPWLPRWWAEEGGRAVAFGSDAHVPELVAHRFPDAVRMAEAAGFRPGRRPEDLWTR